MSELIYRGNSLLIIEKALQLFTVFYICNDFLPYAFLIFKNFSCLKISFLNQTMTYSVQFRLKYFLVESNEWFDMWNKVVGRLCSVEI